MVYIKQIATGDIFVKADQVYLEINFYLKNKNKTYNIHIKFEPSANQKYFAEQKQSSNNTHLKLKFLPLSARRDKHAAEAEML